MISGSWSRSSLHRCPLKAGRYGRYASAGSTVEQMVAAILKVDPEGITGHRSEHAKKARAGDETARG